MKENIEYYTFTLLQFCPILFALFVILNNRETSKNMVLQRAILGSIIGFLIGVFGYFQFIFEYAPHRLNKELINILVATLLLGSVWLFVFGVLMAIFNSNQKKWAVILIISSIVSFIIGFGTCASNFSMDGMH